MTGEWTIVTSELPVLPKASPVRNLNPMFPKLPLKYGITLQTCSLSSMEAYFCACHCFAQADLLELMGAEDHAPDRLDGQSTKASEAHTGDHVRVPLPVFPSISVSAHCVSSAFAKHRWLIDVYLVVGEPSRIVHVHMSHKSQTLFPPNCLCYSEMSIELLRAFHLSSYTFLGNPKHRFLRNPKHRIGA